MTKRTVYIVIQEGGSSTEAYPTSFNTMKAAERARRSHSRATYRSSGPIEATVYEHEGRAFIEEGDVMELMGRAAVIGARQEYEG